MMENKEQSDKPILKLKNDYVFRYVFTRPEARDALKDLLLSILDLPEGEFGYIEIDDPNLYRRNEGDKACELDIRIHTATGRIIHVELQMRPKTSFRERVVYYGSRMIADQLSAGEGYGGYSRVISIAITDFVMIGESDRYHHCFRLYDKDTLALFSDALEVDTLELPKLPEESDGTKLWDWMTLIRAESEEDMEAVAKKNEHMQECVMVIRKMSRDEAERRLAEAREKQERDRYAEQEWALEEGHKRGLEQGAALERLENARRMKADGVDAALIRKYTGLSAEEIGKIES
jgi:predicted transposase/invertase (TIGR01784 family)